MNRQAGQWGLATKSGDAMTKSEDSGVRVLSDREVSEAIAMSPFHQALSQGYECALQELQRELAEVLHDMDDADEDAPTIVVSDDERSFWRKQG